jgi:hypothetical protein
MSLITKSSTPGPDLNSLKRIPPLSPLTAGEDLAAAAPCYIASDGLVYECISTQTIDGKAKYAGFTPVAYSEGEVVTLFGKGARFDYSSAMTPGNFLWVSATAGRLDTSPVIGIDFAYDQVSTDDPVALIISATDILVLK